MDKLLPVRRDGFGSHKWPQKVRYSLLALAKGPGTSQVESGEALYHCILDMQRESNLGIAPAKGISLFFDNLSRSDARTFFHRLLPQIANLALSLPVSLENPGKNHPGLRLRVLHPQERGMVVLSQHTIASLLACCFLCLYPSAERRKANLPYVNFDRLFAGVYKKSHEHKLLCLLHYFERVCHAMPNGAVSFERKVINLRDGNHAFWSASRAPLCPLTVVADGSIEDLGQQCLQVDFANRVLGGGALADGCVQEEIRFMINPELIAGMIFLPGMAANESIEIVGAERYSSYTGYASSFRFSGDFRDSAPRDSWGRRQTHIIAIDALSQPGDEQFRLDCTYRELSKAYCGFLDTGYAGALSRSTNLKGRETELVLRGSDSQTNGSPMEDDTPQVVDTVNGAVDMILDDPPCTSKARDGGASGRGGLLGVATGNWGCGVFGGNLELKSMLQWLAASQAGRPHVLYCSFQNPAAQRLQEVADWVLQEGWFVGELWSLICEYGQNKHFSVNLFDWILPGSETDLDISHQRKAATLPTLTERLQPELEIAGSQLGQHSPAVLVDSED